MLVEWQGSHSCADDVFQWMARHGEVDLDDGSAAGENNIMSIISRHNTRHTGQEGGNSVCESHETHKSSLLALATN